MNDMDKVVLIDILQTTNYFNRIPTKRLVSSRDRYIEYNLYHDVRSIQTLNLTLEELKNLSGHPTQLISVPDWKSYCD